MTEAKKAMTLHQMEESALTLVKQDRVMTDEIDTLVNTRTKLRKELRALNGKIVTIKQNEQLKA